MTHRRRWRVAAGALLLLAGAVIALAQTETASTWTCEELQRRLPELVNADVQLASCHVDASSLSIKVGGVTVQSRGATPFTVKADEAAVSLRGLFFGGVALHEVRLLRPTVEVTLSGAGAQSADCPLDALRSFRIDKVGVENGTVVVTTQAGQVVNVQGLTASASVQSSGIDLEGGVRSTVISLPEQGAYTAAGTAFEAHLDAPTRRFELVRGTTSFEGISLTLSGVLEQLCESPTIVARAQAYVPMQLLARRGLVGSAGGQVAIRLQASGKLDAPSLRADVTASQVTLDAFTPGDLTARLSLAGKTVHIDELVTSVGSGTIRASGEVELVQGLPISLKVETKDAPFGRVMQRASVSGSWVDFPATLKGTLAGKLLPKPSLSGPVDFHTGAFVLASRGWDAPKAAGREILEFKESKGGFTLQVGDTGVGFEDIWVSVGREAKTRVKGSVKLFYDEARGYDVRVVADAVDLSDFGHISGQSWSGLGNATVTVTGGGDSLVVDGRLALRDFKFDDYNLGVVQGPIHYVGDTLSFPAIVAQKGKSQYFGDLSLIFQDQGLYTRATVQLPDGRVEDMIDLLADLSPSMQNVQGVMTGRMQAVMAFDSPAKEFAGLIAMRVREGEYLGRRLGSANGVLRFQKGTTMVLDPMVFEGPLGRYSVEGSWDFSGPLDYRMSLQHGSLAELVDPRGLKQLPLVGEINAKAVVGGTADLVLTDGDITIEQMKWSGAELGPAAFHLKLVGRELETTATGLHGVELTMHNVFRNEWPFTADFKVNGLDLQPFLPKSAAGVTASVSGTVAASGPLRDVSLARADMRFSQVKIARGEISLSNSEPVSLLYDAGGISVRSLVLKGPTTQVTAEGRWGPRTADLRASGSVDLKLVESFLSSLERPSGRFDFTAAITGDVAKPQIAGSADARDIRAGVRNQDLQLKSGSAHLDFSESRVLLQELQGFLNDGRIRGHGDVRLDGLSIQKGEVQIDLEDVTVQIQPEVPATFSGSLLFATRGDTNQLSGSVDVVKLKYVKPLSLESLLTSAQSANLTTEERPRESVRFDVDIGLGNDVRIENNLARGRLLGKLKLAGTNVKPVLIGAIEATEGSQLFFRNNTYAVSRATLQFNGLWPTFDVSAQTQVREYLVNVKAFGRFEDPKVSFSAEPSLSETDIVSLLTVGVTSRERFASEAGAGLAAEALLSASGLDKQIQRFLQNSVGLKDQQVRLTTTFNESTGTAEPSVSWESKVVSDNLKVGVTQPVTGRGTKAQVEYRFNQGVSARAQWDNQNQNTSVGNPGAEVRFRFEWE